MPGYLAALPQFKAKGCDKVAVLCVNDAFAAKAWGKAQKVLLLYCRIVALSFASLARSVARRVRACLVS